MNEVECSLAIQGKLQLDRSALPAVAVRPPVSGWFDRVVIPSRGLVLPRQLPFEAWLAIGAKLSTPPSSFAWRLGDWLVYREVSYVGRYREALERTSLEYQTLRSYSWVARKFPLSRRRDSLSFGHHAEVAALTEPEQAYWHRKAEELNWSRNRLRGEVRSSRRECVESGDAAETVASYGDPEISSDKEAIAEGKGESTLELALNPRQLELIQKAAAREGASPEAWAAAVLEKFARGHIRGLVGRTLT
jgi:hypothetical protein